MVDGLDAFLDMVGNLLQAVAGLGDASNMWSGMRSGPRSGNMISLVGMRLDRPAIIAPKPQVPPAVKPLSTR